MEEVLHYLDLKNQYYDKFHSMTVKFLENIAQDKWEDVDVFVDNRERILNIIRSFDFKIAKAFEEIDTSRCSIELYRPRVKAMLDRRAEIAKKIVALDLELISKMDDIKSETIRELKKCVETSQQIGAFVAPQGSRRPIKHTPEV